MSLEESLNFLHHKICDFRDRWEIARDHLEHLDANLHDLVQYSTRIQDREKFSKDLEVEQ